MCVGNIDARHSIFNNAGHDLRQTSIHIHIFPFGSQRSDCTSIAIDTGDNNLLQSTSDSSPRASHPVTNPSFSAILDLGITTTSNLINLIMPILLDLQKSSSTRLNSAVELESLHQTLILTKFTIQRYSNMPLSQNLVDLITPEIKQCFDTLQKLLNSVNDVWLTFSISMFGGLCRRIWCREWDEDQFPSLRKKLSHSQQMLQEFLITLHLYVLIFLAHFVIS
jgi:hypothetical protein